MACAEFAIAHPRCFSRGTTRKITSFRATWLGPFRPDSRRHRVVQLDLLNDQPRVLQPSAMSHTQLEAEAESLIPGWTGDSISEASTVPALNKDDKFRALARLIGCCLCCFAAGWHDGCAGALMHVKAFVLLLYDKQSRTLKCCSRITSQPLKAPTSFINKTLMTMQSISSGLLRWCQ